MTKQQKYEIQKARAEKELMRKLALVGYTHEQWLALSDKSQNNVLASAHRIQNKR